MVRKDLTKEQAASVRRRNKSFRAIETNRLRRVESSDDSASSLDGAAIGIRLISPEIGGSSLRLSVAIAYAAGQAGLPLKRIADVSAILVTMRNDPEHRKALIEWLGEA